MSDLGQESKLIGPAGVQQEEERSLFDYAVVVWRYRWLIVGIVVVAVLTTFVVTVRTPRIYESTAALLASRETSAPGGFTVPGALLQLPGLPSSTPNRDMAASILRSRTLMQAVAEQFRLQERYRARYLEDAIKGLQGATNISVSKEGVISVKVEDTDPRLAADMANYYVEQLDRLMAQYGMGEAGRQRVFLTEQVARAKTDLGGAEEALRRFQERNRAIALPEQTRGAIDAAAGLKGQIMAVEVQLQVMRSFATEANPEMVALRRRIEEMKRQLAQTQYGDGGGQAAVGGRDRRDFTVPLPKVPEVALELARLTRDVKVQETVVSLLTHHLGQARIAEARDLPIVQVLDRAVPTAHHSKPRLRSNLAIAGVTSLFVGIFLAFFLEYLRNLPRRTRAA